MITTRALRYLYVLASLLAAHATVVSVHRGAAWYALGFAGVDLLLLVAAIREYHATEERRAVAVRAERLVRLRALVEADALAFTLDDACCETWWTSCGTAHDYETCDRIRRAA